MHASWPYWSACLLAMMASFQVGSQVESQYATRNAPSTQAFMVQSSGMRMAHDLKLCICLQKGWGPQQAGL